MYPDVEPWYVSTSGYRFADTYHKAARKALRRLRVRYKHHLRRNPMGFFPPIDGRGRSWVERMRRLGQEEEELEDTVSHLSIYVNGLDKLYRETVAQLKEQTRRAEGAEQALVTQQKKALDAVQELERNRAFNANLWKNFIEDRKKLEDEQERRREAEEQAAKARADLHSLIHSSNTNNGWISEDEEEPMEVIHIKDKATQTEEEILEQHLPLKKRHICSKA